MPSPPLFPADSALLRLVLSILGDIASVRHHARDFHYYRSKHISGSVRVLAAMMGVATPLWIVADLWLLGPGILPAMAGLRLGAAAALIGIALWRPSPALAAARTQVALLLLVPTLFFVGAQWLAGGTLNSPALIGYTTLPLFLVALLALLPLTLLETAAALALVGGPVAGYLALTGQLLLPGGLGLMWLLLLMFAFAFIATGMHLYLLMLLFRQATRDPLTGLRNRGAAMEWIQSQLERNRGKDYPLALIMIDLDRFKLINDHYGHPAGDEVLQHLAHILGREVPREDMLCRYGGEEFLLVIPGAHRSEVEELAERIRETASRSPAETGAGTIAFTLSLGVTEWQGESLDELVEQADRVLYDAKESGRDRVVMAGD